MKQKLLNSIRLRALLLVATLLVGGANFNLAWGDEAYYTLDTTGSLQTENNAYASNGTATSGKIEWILNGNGKRNPWCLGGKSITKVDRVVYTKTPMGAAISSIDLTVGAASSITVNSLNLIVASDASFETELDKVKATFRTNSTITFEPTSGESWAKDAYYKFVFNVTVSGSTNKFVEFNKVEFYEAAAAPSYTITAQSNNNSYGTVSLSGSVITASPASGYTYADPAYTVSPANSATVAQEGNEFTVTPTANTTVTINFEAIPAYTVTLGDDSSTLTEASGGAGVTLPSREDVGSYTFAGWSTTNVTVETTEAPTIITVGTYHPTTNVTLYPVYTKTIGGNVESSNVFSSGSYANSVITWSIADVVSITQEQNGAATAPNSSYVDAPRWYKDNLITITPSVTINSISVTASSSSYATALAGSTYTNATAEVDDKDDKVVSITPTNGNNPITITMGGQSRLSSLTVNYYGGTTFYTSTPSSQEKVTPVSITPASCAVVSGQELTMTMTCETEDVSIYYTTDGTDPTEGSTLYDNEDKPVISITTDTTIKAIGIKDGYTNSDITSVTFSVAEPCATPAFSVAAGEVEKGKTVAITCATDGATIYYTTNGDEPTTSSDVYSSPLTINAAQTIKAIAAKEGNANSAVASASYTIQDYATLPFAWVGGTKSALQEKSGVTTSGLGSDYAEGNAPYRIKMDGVGDYIQVKTNAQPGKVYVGVKMIGGDTTSKIKVQESADGTSFTDVEEFTVSGKQNDVLNFETSNSFAATTRYVKIIKSVHGSNVGVGPITITGCEAVTVGSAGYTTYVTTGKVEFPVGVTGYIATAINTSTVHLDEKASVPAATPIVVKAAAGTYALPVITTTPESVTGNLLQASNGSVTGDGSIYALANLIPEGETEPVVGFYQVEDGIVIPAGKAYLVDGAGVKGFTFDFDDDDATAIEKTLSDSPLKGENIYNLAGQRLDNSQLKRGIYIVNGKKVLK